LKAKGLSILFFILALLFLTSAVSAEDLNGTDSTSLIEDNVDLQLNDTQDTYSSGLNAVYVDGDNGNDANDGKSQSTSVKSFEKALSLAGDGSSIYLASGNYVGAKNTRISIAKSLTVIGSDDTAFDGENANFIFKIQDDAKVTFKNIKFINAFKQATNNNQASMYGGALEINAAEVLLDGCSFISNNVEYDSSINKYNYGGAISNFGDLTIINSYFDKNHVGSTSGLFGYGGAVYNRGRLLVNSTVFNNSYCDDFGYGAAIYNDGELIMDRSVISNSFSAQETKASAVYNAGNFTLTNSIIENNTISRASFYYIYGAIYNYGRMTGYGNIFRNNSGIYEAPNPEYRGSPTIFNVGDLNLTYSVFMDNAPFNGIASDVYLNGGKITSLDDNWWSTNDDPFTKSKINVADMLNSWFIFNLSPEYTAININQNADLNAFWSLSSTLTPKLSMFPVLNVTFSTSGHNITKQLIDGQCIFTFTYSQNKGLYTVESSMGEFSQEVLVDVGKIKSNLKVSVTDNVTYTDNIILTVNVTGADGNIPTGNVSVIVDKTTFVINLTDGRGLLNISNLDPNKYNFKIVYEGSDDYFKAFEYANVSVNKAPTDLKVYFPDIKVDQKGSVTVTLGPSGVQGQAYLYINGVRKKVLYLYNGNTTVAISNFAEGEYNVTLDFWGTKYYEASSASTTFRVSKYDASLNVTASDISLGETECISIRVTPSDLRGEAILNINGVNQTIFLDSEVTDITIGNLTYGRYDIWVYFAENQKYHSCNVSDSFRVLRTLTSLDVDIIEDGFDGKITVKTNYADCKGSIGVYVNFRLYYADLVNGMAKFNVTFDKGTNYIYVFYDGDNKYEASNWNTTLGVGEEFIMVGENSTGYEYNDFDYIIHLIEVNGIPMPSRKVTVLFDNANYTVTTNDDGIARFSLNLGKGSYAISATYKNQTVTNTLTVNEIKFNATASDAAYGENAEIIVEFNANLTGRVNLFIEGKLNVTVDLDGSRISYNISGLKVASYDVSVRYSNDRFTSGEGTASFNVFKANPEMDAQINDIVYGENGTIEVALPVDATGEVTFVVDGESQTKALSNGIASIDLIGMAKGTHDVAITYSGDSNYNNASLKSSFNVKDAYSDIILFVNDSHYGENVTVVGILNETATGNVTFTVSGITKTAEIINGYAICIFGGINAGTHQLTAKYPGDPTFISSKNSTSFNVFKSNSTLDLFVNEVYLGENILIYAVVSENATGSVSFSIKDYYSPRDKPISNSIAVWYISPLSTGEYTIVANYRGDDNYHASNSTYLLNITQRKSLLTVNIPDAGKNDRVTAKVTLTTGDGSPITGKVVLKIGTRSYDINVNEGAGNMVIGKLPIADYEYTATYEGNENFSKASASGQFKVVEDLLNLTLRVKDVTCFYGAKKSFVVTVVDDNNNLISGVNIIIKLSGVTHNLTTDSEGKVSIPINLDVGKYVAEVIFYGNLRYFGTSANATIEVLSTVEGTDVVSQYGTTAQYFAIFTDSNGKALANAEVQLTIDGKTHTVKTMLNGISKVNLNFAVGKYVMEAYNPATGQRAYNTIYIFKKIMENKDVTVYYGASQVYKVRAYDDNGNPVGAGNVVTFKVNGKTYNVKTDKNGYATCNLNLKPKSYTITATFGGFKVSNKIVIKPVLTAKNISVKKGKTIKFKAKLVNTKGKALKGKKITFKFKGKTYKAKTNKKGIATLKVKLKLKAGKYKIKVKYSKSSLTRTIKIKK
jgi:hypothetical protein